MRRPGKTKANAGETLVEVMASVVIFLMMVGILQSAILYSRAALEKSRQMREDNEAICEQLRNRSKETGGTSSLNFQAVSADGSITGNQVFSVESAENRYLHSSRRHEEEHYLLLLYVGKRDECGR